MVSVLYRKEITNYRLPLITAHRWRRWLSHVWNFWTDHKLIEALFDVYILSFWRSGRVEKKTIYQQKRWNKTKLFTTFGSNMILMTSLAEMINYELFYDDDYHPDIYVKHSVTPLYDCDNHHFREQVYKTLWLMIFSHYWQCCADSKVSYYSLKRGRENYFH